MAVKSSPKPGSETVGDAIKKLSDRTKKWWSTNPFVGAGGMSNGMLAYYWLRAGGNPNRVNQAVAAALGENHSANPSATSAANSDGSRDVGLWQINTVHGPGLASTDPLTNARAAVHLSKNGTDWSPWCTSYDNGMCSSQGMASPHYVGPGQGNYQSGAPVLPAAVKAMLFAKDAVAGALWAANDAGGAVTPLATPFEPVDPATGQQRGDKWVADANHALGLDAPVQAAESIADVFGGGTVGKILAYAGYALLGAFAAGLLLLAFAILVLALVEKQGALAAIPGVGRVAGAASEVRAGVTARGVRNQSRGASSARKTRVVRGLHGERGKGADNPKPTHGGNQRRARRSHPGIETNRRPSYAGRTKAGQRGPSRAEAGAPF